MTAGSTTRSGQPDPADDPKEATLRGDPRGLGATLGAFLIWGLSPIFWKYLLHVPPSQLLAHRILWAHLILGILIVCRGQLGELAAILRSGKTVITLSATTLLIAANWLTYIWAVLTDRIIEASLGYYINPLVTVFLAMLFLKERLNRAQTVSIGLAAAGVAFMLWQQGRLPWIALVLAFSFGLYSLLRKRVGAEAEVGLLLETSLLLPWVALFLARTTIGGGGAFLRTGLGTDALLVASGLVTAVPLVLFTYGARRLELVTVGFMQFSAPTLQFLLAVLLYDEPFTETHVVTFLCIWLAVALFSWDLRRQWRPPPDTESR